MYKVLSSDRTEKALLKKKLNIIMNDKSIPKIITEIIKQIKAATTNEAAATIIISGT